MSTTTATSTSPESEPTTHLRVAVTALQVANRRGVFELDESANIQTSVKFFSAENEERPDEEQRKHLQLIVGMCEVAQKRGAFNLAEAASVYPHVKYFVQEPETKEQTEEQTEEQKELDALTESVEQLTDNNCCNNSNCDPDNCPCDPNNCPCDENNNCNTKTETLQKPNVEQTIERVKPAADKEANWNNYGN